MKENHLFITLEDKRVTYHNTTGSGAMPTSIWTHDEIIQYLKDLHPNATIEIRDDRSIDPRMISMFRQALEILLACILFTALAYFVFIIYFSL